MKNDEIKFLEEDKVKEMFSDVCKHLDIKPTKEDIEKLVVYEMTDGQRTSTPLTNSWSNYYGGGMFCLRFIDMFKKLGGKNIVINVIHSRHKDRENYQDIYEGMCRLVKPFGEYASKNNVKLRFVGDYDETIAAPGATMDLRQALAQLTADTSKNTGLTAYFMINYTMDWLANGGYEKIWKEVPQVNVILRHAKGYVNGDMWLPKKLDDNSFMYVQNGSVNENWNDKQILYLIGIALRSVIVNRGTHYSKVYKGEEAKYVYTKREKELVMTHKALEQDYTKRAVIFSGVGPEIYEF